MGCNNSCTAMHGMPMHKESLSVLYIDVTVDFDMWRLDTPGQVVLTTVPRLASLVSVDEIETSMCCKLAFVTA